MLKRENSIHEIANAFGMTGDYVQEVLTGRKSHRLAPAELAKEWLLIKQPRPVEELGIKSIEALEFEVLNRRLGKYFPKMKKLFYPKRILLHTEPTEEPHD